MPILIVGIDKKTIGFCGAKKDRAQDKGSYRSKRNHTDSHPLERAKKKFIWKVNIQAGKIIWNRDISKNLVIKAWMLNDTPRKFYEKDKLCRAKVQQSAGPLLRNFTRTDRCTEDWRLLWRGGRQEGNVLSFWTQDWGIHECSGILKSIPQTYGSEINSMKIRNSRKGA